MSEPDQAGGPAPGHVPSQDPGRVLYAVTLVRGIHTDRRLAVLTELGHVRAHAGIALPNDASVGLHESMGFVQVARYPQVGWKHGAWRDVGWWSRPLPPASVPPVEPRRWDGLACLKTGCRASRKAIRK